MHRTMHTRARSQIEHTKKVTWCEGPLRAAPTRITHEHRIYNISDSSVMSM